MSGYKAAFRRSAVAFVALALAACGSPKSFETYQQAIGDFRSATENTSKAAASYILSANAFVRSVEFDRLRADPSRQLNLPRLIQGPYDPAAIRVRQSAFDTLAAYTDLLAKVAGSDAASRWEAAAGTLGANAEVFLRSLDKNVAGGNLAGSPLVALLGEQGPLSKLIAFAGTEFINMKRAEALDAAVINAKPAIEKISVALRGDFHAAVELRIPVINDALLQAGIDYRLAQEAALQDAAKETARLKALTSLESAIGTYEQRTAEVGIIMHAIDGFDRSHEQLFTYAQSEQTLEDLSDLVAVIERYADVAKDAYGTFKKRLETERRK